MSGGGAPTSPFVWREEVLAGDVETVGELVRATGFFSEEEAEVAQELVQARLSQGPPSGYCFLFAQQAGALACYACYGPIPGAENRFDLYWIATSPAFQGQGLGTQLLKEVESRVAALGGQRVYIETSSKALYTPTRHFYLKNGYSLEAQLSDFYRDGDAKMIYVKVL